MSVEVISKIKPKNNGQFPAYDDTDAYGGFQVRVSIIDRNLIPSLNRKAGMLVYVQADGNFYQLGSGLTNSDWTITSIGGGGGFAAGGDLSGTSSSQTVNKIHGATVPVAGALTTGNVLQVSGSSAVSYAPVNLAGGVNFVTGSLPAGNQSAQTLTGDASGTTAAVVIIKLQGNAVQSGTNTSLQDGYVISWINGSSQYQVKPVAGDVTGNIYTNSVVKINGATVPASGSLTTGNVLQVSGSSVLSYGPLNLAGGAAFVSGSLPTANQVNQSMAGDVTGTTAVSAVTKIQSNAVQSGVLGATQDGYVLTWVNGSSQYQVKPFNPFYNVSRITTSYSVLAIDQVISIGTTSAPVNVTLISSPSIGQRFIIKDMVGLAFTNNITILGNGHSIDGSSSAVLNINYQSITVAYDGVGWIII